MMSAVHQAGLRLVSRDKKRFAACGEKQREARQARGIRAQLVTRSAPQSSIAFRRQNKPDRPRIGRIYYQWREVQVQMIRYISCQKD